MFGGFLYSVIKYANQLSGTKEKSLENLKRFTFECGCKVYSDIYFEKQNFVIECNQHMKQLYDLNYYREFQKDMDEYYGPDTTIDYYIMRECKTCHMMVHGTIHHLKTHLRSLKHRETLANTSQKEST